MRKDLDKYRKNHVFTLERDFADDICDATLDHAIEKLNEFKKKHGGDAELDIYESVDGMMVAYLVRTKEESDSEVINRLNVERAHIVRAIESATNNLEQAKKRLAEYDAKLVGS